MVDKVDKARSLFKEIGAKEPLAIGTSFTGGPVPASKIIVNGKEIDITNVQISVSPPTPVMPPDRRLFRAHEQVICGDPVVLHQDSITVVRAREGDCVVGVVDHVNNDGTVIVNCDPLGPSKQPSLFYTSRPQRPIPSVFLYDIGDRVTPRLELDQRVNTNVLIKALPGDHGTVVQRVSSMVPAEVMVHFDAHRVLMRVKDDDLQTVSRKRTPSKIARGSIVSLDRKFDIHQKGEFGRVYGSANSGCLLMVRFFDPVIGVWSTNSLDVSPELLDLMWEPKQLTYMIKPLEERQLVIAKADISDPFTPLSNSTIALVHEDFSFGDPNGYVIVRQILGSLFDTGRLSHRATLARRRRLGIPRKPVFLGSGEKIDPGIHQVFQVTPSGSMWLVNKPQNIPAGTSLFKGRVREDHG